MNISSTPRRLSAFALACLVAVTTAACGSSDSNSKSTETTAAKDTETTAAKDTETTAADAGSERPADWPTKLVFGAVPAEQASSLEADFKTTQEILKKELGLDEIEFFQATDYAGIIEGVIAGRVDVAQFGGFSYVIATSNGADVSVAGVQAKGPDIEPGYRSYAITQADNTEINSIEDFKGKKICFVDPGSTSGFLFPSEGLLSIGLDPSETSTDISPTFAGGHDASAIAVANKDCDAGFAYDNMVLKQLIETGDIKGVVDTVEDENVNEADAQLKIIWKSQVISGAPMAINNKLPESFVKEFQKVLTEKVNVDYALENGFCTGTPEENDCSFADEGSTWGFVAKDDSYYDGIRKVCEITKASKCQS